MSPWILTATGYTIVLIVQESGNSQLKQNALKSTHSHVPIVQGQVRRVKEYQALIYRVQHSYPKDFPRVRLSKLTPGIQ